MNDLEMSLPQRELPKGRQSFEKLRARGEIYVDKTKMIGEIARKSDTFILTRPRRFEKSLLVSTFESLFRYGLRDFKGLAIEKMWNDRTYDVVKLDFSELPDRTDADEFRSAFFRMIQGGFGPLGFEGGAFDSGFAARFSDWLATRPIDSLVLLVDEYDTPLTRAMGLN